MVRQKGFKDYLEDDETLKRKITYDEFISAKQGFDDIEIENAYQSYKEIIDKD